MKKLLIVALMMFTVTSVQAEDMSKDKKHKNMRMHDKMNSDESKGKSKNRKMCAKKCGLDKEKIRKCRKAKGLKKGEKAKGVCLADSQKSCMKKCHKKGKSSMMKKEHSKESKKMMREDHSKEMMHHSE